MSEPLNTTCRTVGCGVWRCLRDAGPGAWLAGMGILALLVTLRWNSFEVPLTRDEGEYAYAARLLTQGLHPYEQAFIQKPPMTIYTYALAGAVAPHAYWFPRVLAALSAVLVTCLLGLMARLEFGPGVALPAMWLVQPLLLCPGLWQFTANTEMFMILPLLGAVAVYVASRHACEGWGAWLLAGALGATALWYKYTAAPILVMLFGIWSVEEGRAAGVRRLMWRWLWALLGAVAVSWVVLAPFLAHDGGRRWWECTVIFNRYYQASATFGISGLRSWLGAFLADWWVLFLLTACLLVRRWPRRWFWLGMFLAGWVSTGASAMGHYYVIVMPFWALLAAVAIHEVAPLIGAQLGWSCAWARRVVLVAVLLLVCLPDLSWVVCTKQQFAAEKAAGGNPFLESPAVARRVAELTLPGDLVYVAGSEPQILYYANRMSPTRFVIAYPLMIATPVAATYQQEAMRDLEQRPPRVIVLSPTPFSWMPQPGSPFEFLNYLEKLLAEHYDPVGGWVGDGLTGSWREPLTPQDQARSSLVVFRRKGA